MVRLDVSRYFSRLEGISIVPCFVLTVIASSATVPSTSFWPSSAVRVISLTERAGSAFGGAAGGSSASAAARSKAMANMVTSV